MKKPSNRWGRTRRHEAPEPYPTHHGRGGGEETGRQSAGAVSSPRAQGTQSQLPRPNGREKPYHSLLSRAMATGESPPAMQAAHSPSAVHTAKGRRALDSLGRRLPWRSARCQS